MNIRENVIRDKSHVFGLKIIRLHLHLSKTLKQFELSSQILRSGTSIGANVEEAIGGPSKKDFTNKMSIAYKEARETKYWLRLLRDSEITDKEIMDAMLMDCEELLKILYTIINTSRSR